MVVEKEINQYYCEYDKRFLPDRFITGTCPRCKSPGQYGDVCEKCNATYEPVDLIEPHCIICGNIPALRKSTHLYVELAVPWLAAIGEWFVPFVGCEVGEPAKMEFLHA